MMKSCNTFRCNAGILLLTKLLLSGIEMQAFRKWTNFFNSWRSTSRNSNSALRTKIINPLSASLAVLELELDCSSVFSISIFLGIDSVGVWDLSKRLNNFLWLSLKSIRNVFDPFLADVWCSVCAFVYFLKTQQPQMKRIQYKHTYCSHYPWRIAKSWLSSHVSSAQIDSFAQQSLARHHWVPLFLDQP